MPKKIKSFTDADIRAFCAITDELFGLEKLERVSVGEKPKKGRPHYRCACCHERFYGYGNKIVTFDEMDYSRDEHNVCSDCWFSVNIGARFCGFTHMNCPNGVWNAAKEHVAFTKSVDDTDFE